MSGLLLLDSDRGITAFADRCKTCGGDLEVWGYPFLTINDRRDGSWSHLDCVAIRTKVEGRWDSLGDACTRCLREEVSPGSFVVIAKQRVCFWWHDECFRVVNPGYYSRLA
jgi:hypothetical protein